MRCKKFDEELIAALRSLGFDIEDDQEVATKVAQVAVIWPTGNTKLRIIINDAEGLPWIDVEREKIIEAASEAASEP
jgi:hypothetical protein